MPITKLVPFPHLCTTPFGRYGEGTLFECDKCGKEFVFDRKEHWVPTVKVIKKRGLK